MAQVVVVGAGLGGLPTAYELRHLLPHQDHQITLISDKDQFTFTPGLISVMFGHKKMADVQLELDRIVPPKGIEFVNGKATGLDPHKQQITAGDRTLHYDYLVIATGPQLATDAIPGLGPETGYTHSVCNPHHVELASEAWKAFLENPGPVIVGAAPGAGCYGPLYEFMLTVDHELRQRQLRDQVPLTIVTPEPYVGHLGVRGVKNADKIILQLLKEKNIAFIENAQITRIEPETMILANGQQLPFKFSMILPAFYGAKFLREAPGLTDAKGFVPMLPTQQHPDFPNIYSLGVATQLAQPDSTLVPMGLPKSGEMTEGMGMAVAHNIARDLGLLKSAPIKATLGAVCFAEFGRDGIVFMANPVLPNPATGRPDHSFTLRGPWVPLVKQAFEIYYMAKMRLGLAVPWFERLGLKLLLGLSLVKPTVPSTAVQTSEKTAVVSR
ncbi:MAG: FAD-dependent oxidoreductase [Leptolyngbya sp. SIO1E4]|nr:FAD-dependent oxidoreductase [Leptolyngbya sp. SIO1E4]